jgi:hypothetical protein
VLIRTLFNCSQHLGHAVPTFYLFQRAFYILSVHFHIDGSIPSTLPILNNPPPKEKLSLSCHKIGTSCETLYYLITSVIIFGVEWCLITQGFVHSNRRFLSS